MFWRWVDLGSLSRGWNEEQYLERWELVRWSAGMTANKHRLASLSAGEPGLRQGGRSGCRGRRASNRGGCMLLGSSVITSHPIAEILQGRSCGSLCEGGGEGVVADIEDGGHGGTAEIGDAPAVGVGDLGDVAVGVEAVEETGDAGGLAPGGEAVFGP